MAFRSSKLTANQDINMKKIEEKIRKAKIEKKIFVVLGKYEAIRNGLVTRGWLERILDSQMPYVQPGSERLVTGSLLKNASFYFIWQPKYRPLSINETRKPFINSIIRERFLDFTSKDGIKNCVDSYPWNHIDGIAELDYIPRTHVLNEKSTKEEFAEDYRQTAFLSFIRFLESFEDLHQLFSSIGTITTDCIEFSISKIELLLKIDQHDDVDMSQLFDVCAKYPKDQKKMLFNIQQVIKGSKKFKFENDCNIEKVKQDVKNCAMKINDRWPSLKYDGFHNIWIFKPIGSSSGNGIVLENDDDLIRKILYNPSKSYIAQKYIERPMLIHNRKFDIRIYVLTMIHNDTVDIWLYKNCYIKFATKAFDLEDFHKSIHVTNYAVQKHFMNDNETVPNAKENMWTLQQLIEYFGSIEQPRLWEAKIYPAIKKNLMAVMLPSLEVTEFKNNTFELNGADFMITYDHHTALIEVNSVPALFFSKTVMEMITNMLLEDLIKVVVDHSKNPEAYTGDFELIYSEELPKFESNADINVTGKTIQRKLKRGPMTKINKVNLIANFNTKTNQLDLENDNFIYLKEN